MFVLCVRVFFVLQVFVLLLWDSMQLSKAYEILRAWSTRFEALKRQRYRTFSGNSYGIHEPMSKPKLILQPGPELP